MTALPTWTKPIVVLAAGLFVVSPFGPAAIASHGTTPVPCVDPRGCPDLWADADAMDPEIRFRSFGPGHCAVEEGMVQPGNRRLLTFSFSTPNAGPGDLIIGQPSSNPQWFVWSPCHAHYHFLEYADYRLWTPEEFAQWDGLRTGAGSKPAAQVLAENPHLRPVTSHKQGFCVIDIAPYGVGVPKFLICEFQGISAGWADVYHRNLDGQWVDITHVGSGTYILEEEVNPEHLYTETDYTNNRAWVAVDI